MSENLLKNGGFDGGQQAPMVEHMVFSVVDGRVDGWHGEQHENVVAPINWRVWWFSQPGTFDQPEARLTTEVRRVLTGTHAFQMFAFHRTTHAGLMQRAEVPGHGTVTCWLEWRNEWALKHNDVYWDDVSLVEHDGLLMLTAHAHAWSNAHDVPGPGSLASCPGDGTCSTGAGRIGYARLVSDSPPATGERWSDGLLNVAFRVGIDPDGGDDIMSPTIVWGDEWHVYNAHYTLKAFVQLAPTPPPDPEPVPDPDAPRGLPREQYERTYVLLPPGASAAWARAVVDATWDSHRYTIGGSADDAGVGALDIKRVIAVNPRLWPGGAEALRLWYRVWYPGTEFVAVEAETPAELVRKLKEIE
jgi:hypothetical protein